MAKQVPIVDYLVLGDQPHLEAHECEECGAALREPTGFGVPIRRAGK